MLSSAAYKSDLSPTSPDDAGSSKKRVLQNCELVLNWILDVDKSMTVRPAETDATAEDALHIVRLLIYVQLPKRIFGAENSTI